MLFTLRKELSIGQKTQNIGIMKTYLYRECIANFETPLMTSPIVYAFSSHGLYIPVDTDGNTRHLRATRQTIGTLNSGLYLYHQLFSCACLS